MSRVGEELYLIPNIKVINEWSPCLGRLTDRGFLKHLEAMHSPVLILLRCVALGLPHSFLLPSRVGMLFNVQTWSKT